MELLLVLFQHLLLICCYIYRLININKFQKIKVNIKKQIIYFIIVILMLAVCTINNFKLNLANMMISIAFSIIVNFEFLRKLMTILLKKIKIVRN